MVTDMPHGKPGRGPGRPRFKARSKVATDQIQMRISRVRKQHYVRCAKRNGLTLSEWIVTTLDTESDFEQ
jgi:hypothetical protein